MEPHRGQTVDSKQGYNVIECNTCHFKHLDPIPSEEVLNQFYNNVYFESHKPDYIKTDIVEDEFNRIAYADRLDRLSQFTTGRKILDVGNGSGKFLEFARSQNWICKGVEPSLGAAKHALGLGLEIFTGSFEEYFEKNKEQFDVIHFKNVLEHVADPAKHLQMAYEILNPEGLVYVEVPNDFDFIQEVGVRITREGRSWISIPDHINYFNFRSLERFVQVTTPLRVVMRDTTFPMYLFLWLGLNFIKNPKAGQRAHKIRMAFELFCKRKHLTFLRRFLYRLLAKLGLGRTVILYCKKW